jgi:hypothetical protein
MHHGPAVKSFNASPSARRAGPHDIPQRFFQVAIVINYCGAVCAFAAITKV